MTHIVSRRCGSFVVAGRQTDSTPTLTRGGTYAGGMAVVDVAIGNETPIPFKEETLLRISMLAWVNDGKGLIYLPYAADMGQHYQIRYVAYPSGEVQNVTNDLREL